MATFLISQKQSRTGKELLLLDNYKYRQLNTKKDGTTKWRCTAGRCRAVLTTAGGRDGGIEILEHKSSLEHSHPYDIDRLRRQIVKSENKKSGVIRVKKKLRTFNNAVPRGENVPLQLQSPAQILELADLAQAIAPIRKKSRGSGEIKDEMQNDLECEQSQPPNFDSVYINLESAMIKVEENKEPQAASAAVLAPSVTLPEGTPVVMGYDFNVGVDYNALFQTYKYSGFQSTNFGLAVEEVEKMISTRMAKLSPDLEQTFEEDEFIRRRTNCTIFLGYTSNMVSSGVRDTIRFLVQHRLVDCVVTTAGGVEEDLIKCLAPTYVGAFHLDGRKLRDQGVNRIGNLLVPNNNYCLFEDWVMPILDALLEEQKETGIVWTPSRVITRLGEAVDNPESICYWAAKNKIPIFSPALTDGSLGDMMYFHSYRNPGLVLDIIQDLRRLNTMAVKAAHTGMIILGGGVVKHHICNANLMRNGADFSVFINTASEFDGSDSGARPDEAISWGKIKKDATPVKIYAEASLIFPLLVGETFAKHFHATKGETKQC